MEKSFLNHPDKKYLPFSWRSACLGHVLIFMILHREPGIGLASLRLHGRSSLQVIAC